MGRRTLLACCGVVWTLLVAFGVREIYVYSTTPGRRAAAPERWPAGSHLVRTPGTPAVVMFVHPECPCSRASLAELATIAAAANPASFTIVLSGEGDAWRDARRVPGATLVLDRTGEAARFGATTSGHVVAYGADGSLQFSGGITGSRGHAGDNMGRRAVERVIRGRRGSDHAVFGCAL